MTPVKDFSGLYLTNRKGFRKAVRRLLKSAVLWEKWETAEKIEKEREAWGKCKSLAKSPNILKRFRKTISQWVAGEMRTASLLFLVFTSRLLEQPVSVVIKGPSSAGKSYIALQVLRFFPSSCSYVLTSMSERALIYTEEPFSHRILLILEAAGLRGEFVNYIVRSLLSEGRIIYETVEKTKDGLRARRIVKEGPTGLCITTTAVDLDKEGETRMTSITVDDTPHQTSQILKTQARRINETPQNNSGKEFRLWHSLQLWLELTERRFVIPYAEALSELIPSVAVRLRRDFPTILSLIGTHAILHQARRDRDEQGRVVANFDDYSAVGQLVADLIAAQVEATVPESIRETVRAVEELLKEDGPVTITKVAKKLELDKSAASRRVRRAKSRDYVVDQAKKGQPADLVLGDPLPEEITILPSTTVLKMTVLASRNKKEEKPYTENATKTGTF